ncbi:hypothetical protein U1Q18_047421 [Sarracenia purpurea var. burkii]
MSVFDGTLMGSLETGLSLKRDQHLLRSSSSTNRNERHPFGQRPRSRFSRLVLFKKIDYLQWICTVAVFFFFVGLFQMLLPGSVTEKSENSWGRREVASGDSMLSKEIDGLDFGEDIKSEALKILVKFEKECNEVNISSVSRKGVFADLLVNPQQILMVTVTVALREIGYEIEVYSLEGGPVLAIWKNLGVPVTVLKTSEKEDVIVASSLHIDVAKSAIIRIGDLENKDLFVGYEIWGMDWKVNPCLIWRIPLGLFSKAKVV